MAGVYLLLFVSELIMALICAPHSCQWGNNLYFTYGCICLFICFLIPFFYKITLKAKLLSSIGLSFLNVIIWAVLFLACGLRVICKLW